MPPKAVHEMVKDTHGLHKEHRRRVKQRFLNHGLDNFDDYLVLELLLFYAIPRANVNELAHELMARFQSIHGVFEAPIEELRQVKGIGENAAVLLKLIPQINRRYLISRAASEKDITLMNSGEAGAYIMPYFYAERDEVVYVICLDNKNRVINCRQMFRGDLNSAVISIRKLVEVALKDNATSVMLAHNHTSGVALPSKEDVDTTANIARALKTVEIKLTDHIVVADSDYVSMSQSGYLDSF